MSAPLRSRRSDYAELTRQAIVDAARLLFSRKGYFQTTVEDIAKQARVAPTTVYAVTGGKQGLISTLADIWSQAPIVAESLAELPGLTDPDEILRRAGAVVRSMREDYGDIMRMLLTTAPHNEAVAEGFARGTERYRGAVASVAARLADVGGLHPGMTVQQATDTLWFYFGYGGYFTLVDDNGWSYDRAERWLVAQARSALRSPTP
ncbi:TetR/AcrR family transcriptional regulator [Pseudonocardia acaciae]|uniref:TetR/AcrR family transcriptional regulator n=1 Tax=Pseudonocardia acaciae TaxID=551276 RepID=UPI0004917827|nr:TetR/AcrR family transcriptional regulator [Pseudonocardia acaciae]